MKLSLFTTITDPIGRGDNFVPALMNYVDLADEVVIVNGGDELADGVGSDRIIPINYEWPTEFNWPFIGQQFQRGYEACTGDWVIHADLDFFFHEKDFGRIRQALEDNSSAPAISFYKWQFILPDRYNLKSRLILAVNKKAFGDRITFSGGGDLCQPQLDGRNINVDDLPEARIPFYNYEKLSKKRYQIKEDVERMDRAYYRHFGRYLYSDEGKDAYRGWLRMATGRFRKPQQFISLSDHPKYIQQTIADLQPNQWGFSGFNQLEINRYALES